MLDKKYDFLNFDEKWKQYWIKNQIYKYGKRSNRPTFSVDTPPPTVSGALHIGHISSYTQADMYIRFQRMMGHNVFFPMGFDNNGLPTELLVEKELKVRAHTLPREEFTSMALNLVGKYNENYKNLMMTMGMSFDKDLMYNTIDNKTQKTSQKAFIELAQSGKAFRSDMPAPWCCKCRCSVANAEIEDAELSSHFNYLNFKLADGSGTLPIATTRPEFLPACVAIFVNPKDERYSSFVGKKVCVPLFEDRVVTVIADDVVGIDKGTGVVMCCTFGDQTDVEWWKKYKLPYKQAIDDGGKMTELCGKYAGLKIVEAREQIIEDLKSSGYLYKQEDITHAVKVHERCDTAIEFLTKKQWFIKTSTPELIAKWKELGSKINWHPSNMVVRYNAWVENMNQDWSISRQRYFGIPFPVWYCAKCDKPHFADIKDLPVNPLSTSYNGKCECGSTEFVPESDVLDTWATSSLTPQINTNWVDDEAGSKNRMPMDMRFCARDIINTWDLRTIIRAHYHQNSLPWKNLLVAGWVMADKHNKISKHLANANNKMNLDFLLKNYGADVIRYWCANGAYGRDVMFSEDGFKDGYKLSNKLWNASKFVLSFLEDYSPNKPQTVLPVDNYYMHKYNQMLAEVIDLYNDAEVGFAKTRIEKFFWDFCDNYIELAKNRLYKPEVYGEHAKLSAQWASYNILLGLLKVISITMPFITEEIYQAYFAKFDGEESIHLTTLAPLAVDKCDNIIEAGDELVELVSAMRQFKSENQISLKTKIKDATVKAKNAEFIALCDYDIKAVSGIQQLNVEKADNLQVTFGEILQEE